MFDKHRRRRVIYNDDGDQQFVEAQESYGYHIVDGQSFVEARTTPTFDTHVDTYVWCLGNGADPPWGGGQFKVLPCLGSHTRATDLIVEACHRQGMEVWGSLRMNDIHDSFRTGGLEDTDDPVKAENPEWMIEPPERRNLAEGVMDRYLWSAFNFALPGVREYRLAFIEKTASEHDLDGYELDFTRFIWNFPLGQERQYAHLMTGLVRQARSRLNAIGRSRGRPYTFVVHVFDSPETSLELGLEVEAWLDEGLVDVLAVGMGYMPYVLKLDQWVELGARYDVPVYPSINTNTYAGDWKKLNDGPVFHEALRASTAYYWQEGADGQYLFNLFCQQDRRVAGLDPGYIYAPLCEIGDPTSLRGKDKLYAIQPTADRGFCQHGSEKAPLPIALDRKEHVLPLKMGPDATDTGAKAQIRAWTTGGDGAPTVWLRLNHKLLETIQNGNWYEAEVPPGLLRPGSNILSIWCDEDLASTSSPVIVHRIFLPVSYHRP